MLVCGTFVDVKNNTVASPNSKLVDTASTQSNVNEDKQKELERQTAIYEKEVSPIRKEYDSAKKELQNCGYESYDDFKERAKKIRDDKINALDAQNDEEYWNKYADIENEYKTAKAAAKNYKDIEKKYEGILSDPFKKATQTNTLDDYYSQKYEEYLEEYQNDTQE